MKTQILFTSVLAVFIGLSGTSAKGQTVYDVSRDYLTMTNPGGAWTYGWKPTLIGTFTPLTIHLTQPEPGGGAWELWARALGSPTSVYRNAGTVTLTSDGGDGVYPPGSMWFGPGVEPSEDRFGVIRFTVPPLQGGRYRIAVAVRTRLDVGGSDADFNVLHNDTGLFGINVEPVSAAGYTNELNLVEGDTIDFLCGRGNDGKEYGGGLKISARISKLGGVAIRVSQVELCWDTETNLWYQVQYQSSVTTNLWLPLHAGYFPGTGSMVCTNDPVLPGAPRRFYQVINTTNAPPAR